MKAMDSPQEANVDGLLNAIKNGKVRAVNALLDAGANVNVTDATLSTPLMRAVYVPKEDVRTHIVRLLLNHGSEVNARDKNGRTALMHAAFEKDRQDVVRQIIRTKKCDPNMRDVNGDTALTYAVVSDNASVIRTLVNSAYMKPIIDVNCKNKDKVSPLQIAVNLRHIECCQILVNEGGVDTSELSDQSTRILKKLLNDDVDAQPNGIVVKNGSEILATSHPSVKLEKISIHSHGSSSSDEMLDNGDGATRKNDKKSYKCSRKLPVTIHQISAYDSDTNSTIKTSNAAVKKINPESGPVKSNGAGSECDRNSKTSVTRPLIRRPVQNPYPLVHRDNLQVPEVVETVSNYPLSPRSERYRTKSADMATLSLGSEAQMTSQLFHRKKHPLLSPDTKRLADVRTKLNIADQQSNNKLVCGIRTHSSENLAVNLCTNQQSLDSGRNNQLHDHEFDTFSVRRDSLDFRPANGNPIDHVENVRKSPNELSPMPRYPARLRPLSATVSNIGGHISFPHL